MTTPPPWNGPNPPQPSGWDKNTPPPTPPQPGWDPQTPPPMPTYQPPPTPPPGMYGTPQMPGLSGMQPMLQLPAETLVTIGDIICTQSEVITPSGRRPIGQVTWSFTDMSRTTKSIPTWAVVCCIIFVWFCLFGLLFLLAKEERTEGSIQVIVQGPGLLHQLQVPVYSVMQVQDYNARVGYARSLTAAASMSGM